MFIVLFFRNERQEGKGGKGRECGQCGQRGRKGGEGEERKGIGPSGSVESQALVQGWVVVKENKKGWLGKQLSENVAVKGDNGM